MLCVGGDGFLDQTLRWQTFFFVKFLFFFSCHVLRSWRRLWPRTWRWPHRLTVHWPQCWMASTFTVFPRNSGTDCARGQPSTESGNASATLQRWHRREIWKCLRDGLPPEGNTQEVPRSHQGIAGGSSVSSDQRERSRLRVGHPALDGTPYAAGRPAARPFARSWWLVVQTGRQPCANHHLPVWKQRSSDSEENQRFWENALSWSPAGRNVPGILHSKQPWHHASVTFTVATVTFPVYWLRTGRECLVLFFVIFKQHK